MQQAADDSPGKMFAVLGLSQEATEKMCAAAAAAAEAEAAEAESSSSSSSSDSSSSSSSSSRRNIYCGVANYLCKGNYAVSVSNSGVSAVQAAAAAAGAKRCVPLAVSGAFHSPLMQQAAEGLKTIINNIHFNPPTVPVIFNVDAKIHSDPQYIKQILVKQVNPKP